MNRKEMEFFLFLNREKKKEEVGKRNPTLSFLAPFVFLSIFFLKCTNSFLVFFLFLEPPAAPPFFLLSSLFAISLPSSFSSPFASASWRFAGGWKRARDKKEGEEEEGKSSLSLTLYGRLSSPFSSESLAGVIRTRRNKCDEYTVLMTHTFFALDVVVLLSSRGDDQWSENARLALPFHPPFHLAIMDLSLSARKRMGKGGGFEKKMLGPCPNKRRGE